eukprot:GHVQ01004621.1.p1 GENE.GHVQ01004621.1~~GHVQ01004621.1.p1  ORF type:complete len:236 (+),score=22.19 GHVQ01004621.1:206-913(+)
MTVQAVTAYLPLPVFRNLQCLRSLCWQFFIVLLVSAFLIILQLPPMSFGIAEAVENSVTHVPAIRPCLRPTVGILSASVLRRRKQCRLWTTDGGDDVPQNRIKRYDGMRFPAVFGLWRNDVLEGRNMSGSLDGPLVLLPSDRWSVAKGNAVQRPEAANSHQVTNVAFFSIHRRGSFSCSFGYSVEHSLPRRTNNNKRIHEVMQCRSTCNQSAVQRQRCIQRTPPSSRGVTYVNFG